MDNNWPMRLVHAVNEVAGPGTMPATALHNLSPAEPLAVFDAVRDYLPGRSTITGTYEARLLVAEHPAEGGWYVASLDGRPLGERDWPEWTRHRLKLRDPESWHSSAELTDSGVRRLFKPEILLVALYHPENFPLPRFPLAISDVARAARSTLSGRVRMMDMQLGVSMDDVIAATRHAPDIVGISATFGQHDLMVELLDEIYRRPAPPLVLTGGSLTVRNEQLLLARYPGLLVARGAGEPTMVDIIAHFHGDLDLADVRGIGYNGAARGGGMTIRRAPRRTATVANRAQTDILPELDLLDRTFRHRGVAQLETSRGCTNYCSFCPRGHKGIWSGAAPEGLPWMLAAMSEVFERHPHLSRTLYLVDEEFIGRGDDAAQRALVISRTMHDAGFRWESSCRIDQVVDPQRDRAWHLERGHMWRELVATGLRRMLFGVESGVTSILERFNKETTGEQNALAIRTLSALGVPTRFTYITFDHLMTLEELRATHDFQARTDLLLRPLHHLSVEEIVDGVTDARFVSEHSLGAPFYTAVSYLLVSMECLLGAAYTRRVEAAGLAGEPRPSMGRVDASFADWRIGRASHHAQMWVDRNFALDYTLKSLEKILEGEAYHAVREVRRVIKAGAFTVLSDMVRLIDKQSIDEHDQDAFDRELTTMMDAELLVMTNALASAVTAIRGALTPAAAELLDREHDRWRLRSGWRLINASDSC
jgi:hypothetical protein